MVYLALWHSLFEISSSTSPFQRLQLVFDGADDRGVTIMMRRMAWFSFCPLFLVNFSMFIFGLYSVLLSMVLQACVGLYFPAVVLGSYTLVGLLR